MVTFIISWPTSKTKIGTIRKKTDFNSGFQAKLI